MIENRPFALGGGAPREVEILRGPYNSQEGQYYNKNNNLVDQLLY